MRILIGISIVVLVAILWTTFSIVRHVRKTRLRNKFLREQQTVEDSPILLPLPSVSSVTPLPARFAAPILPTEPRSTTQQSTKVAAPPTIPPPLTAESSIPAGTFSARRPFAAPENPSGSPLSLIAAARRLSHDLPQPSLRTLHPQAETARKPAIEEQPLRILECVPDPTTAEIYPASPAFPSLAAAKPDGQLRQLRPAAPAQEDQQVRRPVRSAHPQPAANGNRPSHRPDWMYFNKDMGDLSDPLPGRIRDRIRLRSR